MEAAAMPSSSSDTQAGPVCAYNEWDPLEEVIVGTCTGATVPPWDLVLSGAMPEDSIPFFQEHGGTHFPQ